MPIDLNDLDRIRQRWLPLSGPLAGVEVLIKHASPREAERFRQKLTRQGVLRAGKDEGWQINTGREDDFFRMFAEYYVLDWRGDIRPEGAAYDSAKMGRVLGASQDAFKQLSDAIADDTGFFEQQSGD